MRGRLRRIGGVIGWVAAASALVGCVAFRERVARRPEPLTVACAHAPAVDAPANNAPAAHASAATAQAIVVQVVDDRAEWWAQFMDGANPFARAALAGVDPTRHAGLLFRSRIPLPFSSAGDPLHVLPRDLAQVLESRGYLVARDAKAQPSARLTAHVQRTLTWDLQTVTTGGVIGDVALSVSVTVAGPAGSVEVVASIAGAETVTAGYITSRHHEAALNGAYCRALAELEAIVDSQQFRDALARASRTSR